MYIYTLRATYRTLNRIIPLNGTLTGCFYIHLLYRFIFTKYIHEQTGARGKTSSRKIDLIQKPSTEASQHFDHRQRFVLDGLIKMKAAASDIQTAIRLFQEVDADNSGKHSL